MMGLTKTEILINDKYPSLWTTTFDLINALCDFFFQNSIPSFEKVYGKCSKISNTSCLPKRHRKQRRPRSDCFWRSSLIRAFPVCYKDTHFVHSTMITNILFEKIKGKLFKPLEHLLQIQCWISDKYPHHWTNIFYLIHVYEMCRWIFLNSWSISAGFWWPGSILFHSHGESILIMKLHYWICMKPESSY